MEEEKSEHVLKMKKMEKEMEEVFKMKVQEKKQKLKDSEADVSPGLYSVFYYIFFIVIELVVFRLGKAFSSHFETLCFLMCLGNHSQSVILEVIMVTLLLAAY